MSPCLPQLLEGSAEVGPSRCPELLPAVSTGCCWPGHQLPARRWLPRAGGQWVAVPRGHQRRAEKQQAGGVAGCGGGSWCRISVK